MRLFCSICKDVYLPCSEVHATNCGHLYHVSCLSTWLTSNRTCPQCRASVSQPFRIYFDVETGKKTDRAVLERHIEVLLNRLKGTEKAKKNLLDERKKLLNEKKALLDDMKQLIDLNKTLEKIIVDLKESRASLCREKDFLRLSFSILKAELKSIVRKNDSIIRLQDEVANLNRKISILKRFETLITGSTEEVNKMIESTPFTELSVRDLCTCVGVLKHKLREIEDRNNKLIKENEEISIALVKEKERPFKEKGVEELIKDLTDKNTKLENELKSLNVSYNEYKKKYYRRFKSLAPLQNNPYRDPSKEKVVDIDVESFLEEEFKNTQVSKPVKHTRTEEANPDRANAKWEELIAAGPVHYSGLSKTSSWFGRALYDKDGSGTSGSATSTSASYAFDGFGGTKKIKLGGPTPVEEFQKIKQNRNKKRVQAVSQKKIIEYFQLD